MERKKYVDKKPYEVVELGLCKSNCTQTCILWATRPC